MAELSLENVVTEKMDSWCASHGRALKDYEFFPIIAEGITVPVGCGDTLPIVKRRLAHDAPSGTEAIVNCIYIPGFAMYDAYGIALVPRESKEKKSEQSESYLKMFSRSAPITL